MNQSFSQTEYPVVFHSSLCLALLRFFIDIFFTSEKVALKLSFILPHLILIIQQKLLSRIFIILPARLLERIFRETTVYSIAVRDVDVVSVYTSETTPKILNVGQGVIFLTK